MDIVTASGAELFMPLSAADNLAGITGVVVNSTALVVAGFALLQLLVVKLARVTGISASVLVAIATGLVAAGYTAFTSYVPTDVQTHVIDFTTRVFTLQWVLYESYKKWKEI